MNSYCERPGCKTLMVVLLHTPQCPVCELAPDHSAAPVKQRETFHVTMPIQFLDTGKASACVFFEAKHAVAWHAYLQGRASLIKAYRFEEDPVGLKWDLMDSDHEIIPGARITSGRLYSTLELASTAHASSDFPTFYLAEAP